MLPMIVPPAKNKTLFCPYDLRSDGKACRLKIVLHRGSVKSAMPHVCNISGEQGPRISPVCPVIIFDKPD